MGEYTAVIPGMGEYTAVIPGWWVYPGLYPGGGYILVYTGFGRITPVVYRVWENNTCDIPGWEDNPRGIPGWEDNPRGIPGCC